MKKGCFLLLWVCVPVLADFQGWFSANRIERLGPEDSSWSWSADVEGRTGWHQILVRPSVRYQWTRSLGLSLGYGWAPRFAQSSGLLDEHRLYQDLWWKTSLGFDLSGSFRLEQRVSGLGRDTNWRMREYIQFRLPIGENGWALWIADEFFYNFGATDWAGAHGFFENRLYVGAYLFQKDSGYRFGYLNQLNKSNGQVNHNLFVGYEWRLGDPKL